MELCNLFWKETAEEVVALVAWQVLLIVKGVFLGRE